MKKGMKKVAIALVGLSFAPLVNAEVLPQTHRPISNKLGEERNFDESRNLYRNNYDAQNDVYDAEYYQDGPVYNRGLEVGVPGVLEIGIGGHYENGRYGRRDGGAGVNQGRLGRHGENPAAGRVGRR